MKRTWTGLIIGGLTGMLGGAAMDVISNDGRQTTDMISDAFDKVPSLVKAGTEKAGQVTDLVKDKGPSLVKAAADKATSVLEEARVPDRVRELQKHVTASDGADRARKATGHVEAKAKEAQ